MKRLLAVLLLAFAIAPAVYPLGQNKIVDPNQSAGESVALPQQHPDSPADTLSRIVLVIVGLIVTADRVSSMRIQIKLERKPFIMSILVKRGKS